MQQERTTHHPTERRIFRRHRPHPRDIRQFIGQTSHVRRTFAGLIFGIAFVCRHRDQRLVAAAAFDPAARVVLRCRLQDARIKTRSSTPSPMRGGATRARQGHTRQTVAAVASTPQGAEFLSKVVRDAHARMIGS
jgi:hypothetical protein